MALYQHDSFNFSVEHGAAPDRLHKNSCEVDNDIPGKLGFPHPETDQAEIHRSS